MTAQAGRDLLLKLKKPDDGNFITVAGLRSRSITLDADSIDVTHAESRGRWRELLGNTGVRHMAISGSGVFSNTAADQDIRILFFNGELREWQIILPNFGRIEGAFHLTNLRYTGNYNSEMTYDITLASAGEITFTALWSLSKQNELFLHRQPGGLRKT